MKDRILQIGTPLTTDLQQQLDDVIDHTVGPVLDLFDLDTGKVRRWS